MFGGLDAAVIGPAAAPVERRFGGALELHVRSIQSKGCAMATLCPKVARAVGKKAVDGRLFQAKAIIASDRGWFTGWARSVMEIDAGHHPFLSQSAAVRDLSLGGDSKQDLTSRQRRRRAGAV